MFDYEPRPLQRRAITQLKQSPGLQFVELFHRLRRFFCDFLGNASPHVLVELDAAQGYGAHGLVDTRVYDLRVLTKNPQESVRRTLRSCDVDATQAGLGPVSDYRPYNLRGAKLLDFLSEFLP